MVEIEWDGFELPSTARRSLRERLRPLASLVDPDGRGRLLVEITGEGELYRVVVSGQNERAQLGAEAHHAHLPRAIERALSLAIVRWSGVELG